MAVRLALVAFSVACLMPCAGCAKSDQPSGPLSSIAPVTTSSPIRPWVDQIGYRTSARKIVIVAGDSPLPDPLAFSVRDAATGETVWQLSDHPKAVFRFDNGEKDKESGDFIDQVDIGSLTRPGRYFVEIAGSPSPVRSYAFNIGDDVYKQAAQAAWKAFYYQSADIEISPRYGGLWHHGLDHHGANQATQAHVYKWDGGRWFNAVGTQVIDTTPYDVAGGWWDAGDFDKYTANEVPVQDELLFAIELLGDRARQAHLNIPPAAGGEYDLLNIVRTGTEFLIKDRDSAGAAFGRVHAQGTCPPEADTSPTQLSVENSTSTMARAGGLAWASVVWTDRHEDPAFAKLCYQESLKSWNLLLAHLYPWPVDPKDPTKELYTGDISTPDYHEYRALAAACYFKITGDKQYDAIVHEETADWVAPNPGEQIDRYPIFWVYSHTPGADPALVAKFKRWVLDSADGVVPQTGENRGYAACIKGYWWGCNALIGSSGVNCLYAAELTTDPAEKKRYLAAAEEYVHYLLGRNAIGLCFLTNLKSIGAEHSAMVMFHSWVGNFYSQNPDAQKYIGEGPGKIGPFPGMVVGGVQPTMKHYINDLDWHDNPWEWNEPDIGYQAPCATLIAYFALCAHAS